MAKNKDKDSVVAMLSESGPASKNKTDTKVREPDPVIASMMKLTIDDIELFDKNPRFLEHGKFESLKESIRNDNRVSGSFSITRRPGADKYVVDAGGNTRLKILKELYAETGKLNFYNVEAMFHPYKGEIKMIIDHLKENDDRAPNAFIEMALSVREIAKLAEAETGSSLSTRKLSDYLANYSEGPIKVSQSLIVDYNYTVDFLYPVLPNMFNGEMGRPTVVKLKAIEKEVKSYWNAHEFNEAQFDAAWQSVLAGHDDPNEFSLISIRNELVNFVVDRLKQKHPNYPAKITSEDVEFEIAHFKDEPEQCPLLTGSEESNYGWTNVVGDGAEDSESASGLRKLLGAETDMDSSNSGLSGSNIETQTVDLESGSDTEQQIETSQPDLSNKLQWLDSNRFDIAKLVKSQIQDIPVFANIFHEIDRGYGFYISLPKKTMPGYERWDWCDTFFTLYWLSKSAFVSDCEPCKISAKFHAIARDWAIEQTNDVDDKRRFYAQFITTHLEMMLFDNVTPFKGSELEQFTPNFNWTYISQGAKNIEFYAKLLTEINTMNQTYSVEELGFDANWGVENG